ncbi:MAG: hypothetical protein M5R40_28230 [Anaerolineae bacterium]|nr:hypothetical protein [Anaerolineae bacterium]
MSDPAQTADIAREEETTHEPAEAAEYQPQWGAWTRQFVIVLLVVAGVYALTLIGPVIQMLIMAFILAFLMYAPARIIARRTPIPFGGAVALLLPGPRPRGPVPPARPDPDLCHVGERHRGQRGTGVCRSGRCPGGVYPDQGIVYILGFEVDFNFLIEPLRPFVLGREQVAPPGGRNWRGRASGRGNWRGYAPGGRDRRGRARRIHGNASRGSRRRRRAVGEREPATDTRRAA